jgi:hypothetical protein
MVTTVTVTVFVLNLGEKILRLAGEKIKGKRGKN